MERVERVGGRKNPSTLQCYNTVFTGNTQTKTTHWKRRNRLALVTMSCSLIFLMGWCLEMLGNYAPAASSPEGDLSGTFWAVTIHVLCHKNVISMIFVGLFC